MKTKLSCLFFVGALFGCGAPSDTSTVVVSAEPAALRAALLAADAELEGEGVPPDALVIEPGITEEALTAVWSSCFDAPSAERLVFDADSKTLVVDARLALELLLP